MSLQDRLQEWVAAVGADIKDLRARLATVENNVANQTSFDGGLVTGTAQTSIVDGGTP